jgi:hypothetical protein
MGIKHKATTLARGAHYPAPPARAGVPAGGAKEPRGGFEGRMMSQPSLRIVSSVHSVSFVSKGIIL